MKVSVRHPTKLMYFLKQLSIMYCKYFSTRSSYTIGSSSSEIANKGERIRHTTEEKLFNI